MSGTYPDSLSWKAWLPTVSLGFAAFIFVTTEMLPVGLLPDISVSLNKSESATGILLTVYAWVVALMSLPLTGMSANWDRRTLVLTLLLLFAAGNLFAAFSNTFTMLMTARVCIAMCHALFWSIATPLATRVGPPGKRAQALSIIVTGTSLAMVLGVPLGTILGHHLGWRVTFGVVGGVALCIWVLMRRLLPPQPSTHAGSLRSLPELFHRPTLVKVYILTLLIVTGHFTAATYLTPYMIQVGGFSQQTVAFLLLVLGGSGIVGSIIGGKYADAYPRATLIIPMGILVLCLLLLFTVTSGLAMAIAICFVWGSSMTCMGLVFQTKVLSQAPDSTDVAVAIYSGTFNIGIGGGALIGSRVFDLAGLQYIGFAGSAFVLAALAFAAMSFFGKRYNDTVKTG